MTPQTIQPSRVDTSELAQSRPKPAKKAKLRPERPPPPQRRPPPTPAQVTIFTENDANIPISLELSTINRNQTCSTYHPEIPRFFSRILHATNNFNTALILNHLIHLSIEAPRGWFRISTANLAQKTNLAPKSIKGACQYLLDIHVLYKKVTGYPAKIVYFVNYYGLWEILMNQLPTKGPQWLYVGLVFTDIQHFKDAHEHFFGASFPIKLDLLDRFDAKSTVYLSYLLWQQSELAPQERANLNPEAITTATKLSPKEQSTIRAKLAQQGVLADVGRRLNNKTGEILLSGHLNTGISSHKLDHPEPKRVVHGAGELPAKRASSSPNQSVSASSYAVSASSYAVSASSWYPYGIYSQSISASSSPNHTVSASSPQEIAKNAKNNQENSQNRKVNASCSNSSFNYFNNLLQQNNNDKDCLTKEVSHSNSAEEEDYSKIEWNLPVLENSQDRILKLFYSRKIQPIDAQNVIDEVTFRINAFRNTKNEIQNPLAYINKLCGEVVSGTFIPSGADKTKALRERAQADKKQPVSIIQEVQSPPPQEKVIPEQEIIPEEIKFAWKSITDQLKQQMSPTIFNTWIKDMSVWKYVDNHLVVKAFNQFKRDFILKNYIGKIRSIALEMRLTIELA